MEAKPNDRSYPCKGALKCHPPRRLIACKRRNRCRYSIFDPHMLTEYQVHRLGGSFRLRESKSRSAEKVEIYSLSVILIADQTCVFLLICNLSKPKHPHNGRDNRIRTCGPMLPKHVRYQLRYIPKYKARMTYNLACTLSM